MNKAHWKALEYMRDGMFVPPELTQKMLQGLRKKKSVGVLFSFEMLETLYVKGFKDVTLILEEQPMKYIRNICTKYGYAVKTIEETKDMKFDSIIGNPPYKQTLHLKFLSWALDHGDQVSFIQPSGWTVRNSYQIEAEVKKKMHGRVSKLHYVNGTEIFQGDNLFMGPLVISYIDKKHEGKVAVQYSNTGNEYEVESIHDMPSGFWEPEEEVYAIQKKMIKEAEKSSVMEMRNGDKKYKLFLPSVCGHISDGNYWYKDDFYTFMYRNSNLTDGKGVEYSFDTEKEGVNFLTYVKSKYARFGLMLNKVHMSNETPRHIKQVPLPPLDREWDDKKIFDYFKVSKKDREIIDRMIPDYY